jgi:hypothetical protein
MAGAGILDGKFAIITGAGSGIGRATSRNLCARRRECPETVGAALKCRATATVNTTAPLAKTPAAGSSAISATAHQFQSERSPRAIAALTKPLMISLNIWYRGRITCGTDVTFTKPCSVKPAQLPAAVGLQTAGNPSRVNLRINFGTTVDERQLRKLRRNESAAWTRQTHHASRRR